MNNIEINYLAVLVCGIAAMVIGFIWYGPFFGKLWMKLNNVSPEDIARRKEMQKSAGPLYLVQFLLTLFQAYVLAWYIGMLQMGEVSGFYTAFGVWVAFVMPTIAGACMWNNESGKVSWTRFWLQAGYQLIIFLVFAWILTAWR